MRETPSGLVVNIPSSRESTSPPPRSLRDSPYWGEWRRLASDTDDGARQAKKIILAKFHEETGQWPDDIDRQVINDILGDTSLDDALRALNSKGKRTASRQTATPGLSGPPQPKRRCPRRLSTQPVSVSDSFAEEPLTQFPRRSQPGTGTPKHAKAPAEPTRESITNGQPQALGTSQLMAKLVQQELQRALTGLTNNHTPDTPNHFSHQPQSQPPLSGEEQSRIHSLRDLYPSVSSRHITAILKGTFDPVNLFRLRYRDTGLDQDASSTAIYSIEGGRITSKEDRSGSLKRFKSFCDWRVGFIVFASIFQELFSLPEVLNAMLRFHIEICQLADIYMTSSVIRLAIEWHDRLRSTNIQNASAWWPISPVFKDQFLRVQNAAPPSPTAPRTSKQLCFTHFYDEGSCKDPSCSRLHPSREEMDKMDPRMKPSTHPNTSHAHYDDGPLDTR